MKLTDKRWKVWRQFIKFAFVGCSNSLVCLLVYYICIGLFGEEFYLWGQTIGYAAAVVNSFFWNSRYVFSDSKVNKLSAFIKMCLCNVVVYIMQMLLLYGFVDMLGISEKIAPVMVIILTLPVNFILNKVFAFR